MNASAPLPAALPHRRCPLCGGPNGCTCAATGRQDVACWCRDVRIDASTLARVPPEWRDRACLCRACAGASVV